MIRPPRSLFDLSISKYPCITYLLTSAFLTVILFRCMLVCVYHFFLGPRFWCTPQWRLIAAIATSPVPRFPDSRVLLFHYSNDRVACTFAYRHISTWRSLSYELASRPPHRGGPRRRLPFMGASVLMRPPRGMPTRPQSRRTTRLALGPPLCKDATKESASAPRRPFVLMVCKMKGREYGVASVPPSRCCDSTLAYW